MNDDQTPVSKTIRDPLAPRRKWTRPAMRRLKAGDAENGITPVIPDGPLSFGS
jgi:hypothetical protein